MNTNKKKQLYEQIMTSVAKEVKKVLNESKKYEFSKKDLDEIREMIQNDKDFYATYCTYGNMERYDTFEDAIDDFMEFLENTIYSGDKENDKDVHRFYILDDEDLGTTWQTLKSGKILNVDNIYSEFKSIISEE